MIDGSDFIMYRRYNDYNATVVTSRLRLFSCYRVTIIIIIIMSCLSYTSPLRTYNNRLMCRSFRDRTIKTILFYLNDVPQNFFASKPAKKILREPRGATVRLYYSTTQCAAKTSIVQFHHNCTTHPELLVQLYGNNYADI